MLQTYDPPKKCFLGFGSPRKESRSRSLTKSFSSSVPQAYRADIGNWNGDRWATEITEREVVGEHGSPLKNFKAYHYFNPHYRTYTSVSYDVVVRTNPHRSALTAEREMEEMTCAGWQEPFIPEAISALPFRTVE